MAFEKDCWAHPSLGHSGLEVWNGVGLTLVLRGSISLYLSSGSSFIQKKCESYTDTDLDLSA